MGQVNILPERIALISPKRKYLENTLSSYWVLILRKPELTSQIDTGINAIARNFIPSENCIKDRGFYSQTEFHLRKIFVLKSGEQYGGGVL